MTTPKSRPPIAFSLDGKVVADAAARPDGEASAGARATVLVAPNTEPIDDVPLPAPRPPRRRSPWGPILAGALAGLIMLQVGLSVDRLIEDLFSRATWLGWTGSVAALVAVVALFGLIVREIAGLRRLRQIEQLRIAADSAAIRDDAAAARRSVADLSGLYADRPETARARHLLASQSREIVDGRDLLILAERDLIGPIEAEARAVLMESARRVTLVTAISPRASIDILYVLYENMRLLRRLSDLYGGRPGTLGFLTLARRVLEHLGITGGMALGDGLAQQLLGQGMVGRLSARLGEGVVNGMLTARIGLAAIDLVRPMPRLRLPKPTLGDVASELAKLGTSRGTSPPDPGPRG